MYNGNIWKSPRLLLDAETKDVSSSGGCSDLVMENPDGCSGWNSLEGYVRSVHSDDDISGDSDVEAGGRGIEDGNITLDDGYSTSDDGRQRVHGSSYGVRTDGKGDSRGDGDGDGDGSYLEAAAFRDGLRRERTK